MFDRLKRITDLFIEGREAELGLDEHGQPVLIWVNKPNSFEDEEARRDGLAARTERLLELKDPTHPDVATAQDRIEAYNLDELVAARANQKHDEDFVAALNDLEADKEWAEKLEYLRRTKELLDDAAVPADDPRRQLYAEVGDEYQKALTERVNTRQEERRHDLWEEGRDALIKAYMQDWKERDAFGAFMEEKRVTELFFALRDCQAVKRDDKWDHAACDHRTRLLVNRSDVRSLPQGVIDTVVNVLEDMSATPREAGNSAAPESSSASSEQPSDAEESTPSIPVETPSGVPAT